MSETTLEQTEQLACTQLLDFAKTFYQNPANLKAYEAWKQSNESNRRKLPMAKIELNITFDTKEETLEAVLNDLRSNFVDSLNEAVTEEAVARISKAAVDTVKGVEPVDPEFPDGPAPSSAPAPVEAPAEVKPEPKPTTEMVSKTDVRALATALSKAGKKAELRAIFEKFGAQKLSDIQESDYPALKKELEDANA